MGIYHGGFDVLMAEELLNRPDVIAPLEQMRRERMPEGVAAIELGTVNRER